MKVKELLTFLQSIDQELEVMILGYEEGYDNARYCQKEQVALNVTDASYCGQHEEFDPDKHNSTDYEVVEAVIIY